MFLNDSGTQGRFLLDIEQLPFTSRPLFITLDE